MKVKVCGMRDEQNLLQLLEEPPDFVGFIFYKKSLRFVGNISPETTDKIPAHIKKTGVFVNGSIDDILEKVQRYKLDLVQLHGKESPSFCATLKQRLQPFNTALIKVFNVDEAFNFNDTAPYEGIVDFYLFDTKGKLPGGNGEVFNWQLLSNYKGKTPYFLSGGIGFKHVETLKSLALTHLYAIDINSKFETAPALKNTKLIHDFILKIRKNQNQ